MVFTNALLRLSRKKIYYIGCGIGDLSGYSRWLAQLSGCMASAIVVREQRSAKTLNLPKVKVLPDLAINLPYHQPVLHTISPKRPFSIVVSMLWSVPDPAHNFPVLVKELTALLDSLPAEQFKITLLPMHVAGEKYDDLWASQELALNMKRRAVEIYSARDLPSIISLLAESDLVLGGRLHANILAVLNGTPAIGIAYRPKVQSFFTDNGLADYVVGISALHTLPQLFWHIHNDYARAAKVFYKAGKTNLSKRAAYATLVSDL